MSISISEKGCQLLKNELSTKKKEYSSQKNMAFRIGMPGAFGLLTILSLAGCQQPNSATEVLTLKEMLTETKLDQAVDKAKEDAEAAKHLVQNAYETDNIDNRIEEHLVSINLLYIEIAKYLKNLTLLEEILKTYPETQNMSDAPTQFEIERNNQIIQLKTSATYYYFSVLYMLNALAELNPESSDEIYQYVANNFRPRMEQYGVLYNASTDMQAIFTPAEIQKLVNLAFTERDENIINDERGIAELVREMAEERLNVEDYIQNFDLIYELLEFYFENFENEYHTTTRYDFNGWLTNLRSKQSYSGYLEAYGVSEDDVSEAEFNSRIQDQLVLDDLMLKYGLKYYDLHDIVSAKLDIIFQQYSPSMKQMREMVDWDNPLFIENLKLELQKRLTNGQLPENMTVDYMIDLMRANDNLFFSEAEFNEMKLELTNAIMDKIYWGGRAQGIEIESQVAGISIVQLPNGEAFILIERVSENGIATKEKEIPVKIFDGHGNEINLTQIYNNEYFFPGITVKLISGESLATVNTGLGEGVEMTSIKIFFTASYNTALIRTRLLPSQELKYLKTIRIETPNNITDKFVGVRAISLSQCPECKDNNSPVAYGIVTREDIGFKFIVEKDGLIGGYEKISVGEVDFAGLIPGWYTQRGLLLKDLIGSILGTQSIVAHTPEGILQVETDKAIVAACYEMMTNEIPGHVFMAIGPKNNLNNTKHSLESSEGLPGAQLYIATTNQQSLLNEIINPAKIRIVESSAKLEGFLPLRHEMYETNKLKIITIEGISYYVVVTLKNLTEKSSLSDSKIWKFLSLIDSTGLLSKMSEGDHNVVMLLVPVDETEIIQLDGGLEKLLKAGLVKDIAVITAYLLLIKQLPLLPGLPGVVANSMPDVTRAIAYSLTSQLERILKVYAPPPQ